MEELKKQLLAAAKSLAAQLSVTEQLETIEIMVLEGSEIYNMARSIEILVHLICVIDDRATGGI